MERAEEHGAARHGRLGAVAEAGQRARHREPGRVVVRGLDALDGTPVLDLNPYFPAFDRGEGARTPEWVDRLMAGYFA